MDHIWFVLASLVVLGKGNQIGLKRLNGSYNERCEIIRFNVVEITKLAGAIVYFILPSYSNCSIMFMARIWGFVAIFSAHEIIKDVLVDLCWVLSKVWVVKRGVILRRPVEAAIMPPPLSRWLPSIFNSGSWNSALLGLVTKSWDRRMSSMDTIIITAPWIISSKL